MPAPENSASPTPAPPSDWTLWDEGSINSDPAVLALQPKREQAAVRLRERLSCVPFYAKRAAAAKARTGDDLEYWISLLGRVD